MNSGLLFYTYSCVNLDCFLYFNLQQQRSYILTFIYKVYYQNSKICGDSDLLDVMHLKT
jgi:hypothetical protein